MEVEDVGIVGGILGGILMGNMNMKYGVYTYELGGEGTANKYFEKKIDFNLFFKDWISSIERMNDEKLHTML